jgi:hypothetical protein
MTEVTVLTAFATKAPTVYMEKYEYEAILMNR